MNSRKLHINDLPSEILQHIFAFLPHLQDRKSLSPTCRLWNELAFDYSYLGHIERKMIVTDGTVSSGKISRYYRKVYLIFNLADERSEQLSTWFEKPGSSVEEFACNDSSKGFLSLQVLSMCRRVRKVNFRFPLVVPDQLPVLDHLEELVIAETSRFDVFHLAPNLRRLEISGYPHDLPTSVQKKPFERVRLSFMSETINVIPMFSAVTKLTSVDMFWSRIDQRRLEELCKFCPLLSKLRIFVSPIITSLRCLASLTHLKVLSLNNKCSALSGLLNDVCLFKVEIVEFYMWYNLHFCNSLQRAFPNVHYLQLLYMNAIIRTERVSDGFPQLRTLEVTYRVADDIFELLEVSPNLRELIVCDLRLSGSRLPRIDGLQQLTLKDSELEATNTMAKFPNLQFLNLYGTSRCTYAEKLPSKCTVRRYLRDRSAD